MYFNELLTKRHFASIVNIKFFFKGENDDHKRGICNKIPTLRAISLRHCMYRLFAIETLLNFTVSGFEYKIVVTALYSFISNFRVYTDRISGKSTSVISFAREYSYALYIYSIQCRIFSLWEAKKLYGISCYDFSVITYNDNLLPTSIYISNFVVCFVIINGGLRKALSEKLKLNFAGRLSVLYLVGGLKLLFSIGSFVPD